MSDDAQLVFCPYNYIINPVIRAAMDVDIKGAIVILDEAQWAAHLFLFSCQVNEIVWEVQLNWSALFYSLDNIWIPDVFDTPSVVCNTNPM